MTVVLKLNLTRDSEQALQRAFEKLRRVGGDLRRPLGQIGQFVRRDAQRRLGSRRSPWGRSSGRLRQTLAMEVYGTTVVVGTALVYGAIQQVGGTVRPKRKYLAIPVKASLRHAGTWPRDLPRDSMEYSPAEPIRVGGRFWVGPALVSKVAPGSKPEVLFALVKKVTIKGRPYLAFERQAQAFAVRAVLAEYERAIRGIR